MSRVSSHMCLCTYSPPTVTKPTNITGCTCPMKQKSDENVPEAQDTADGVGDVMPESTVVRDKDSAEIFDDILSIIDNSRVLTLI